MLEDELGDQHALIATAEGMCPVPWIAGDDQEEISEANSTPGLVSSGRVRDAAGTNPIKPELLAAFKGILAALFKLGLVDLGGLDPALRKEIRALAAAMPDPPEGAERPIGVPAGGTGTSDQAGAEGSGGAEAEGTPGDAGAAESGGGGSEEPNELEQAAIDALPSAIFGILGTGIADGGFPPPSAFLNGLTGLGMGVLQGLAMNQLMSMLGGAPKDTDSTLKWAMALLGPKLAGMMLDKGLVSEQFLGGLDGPYQGAALRVGDLNEKGESITAGLPTVEIEGKHAARDGDPMDPNGVAVRFGAEKVLLGGKPAARADNARNPHYGSQSTKTQTWFPLNNGAAKTFIGGQTSNPKPEVPKELQDGPGGKGGAGNLPSLDKPDRPTKADMPDGRAYVWDPHDREWYIWDPEQGFSSNLTGLANLIDVPDFVKDIFGWGGDTWGDINGENDWTLLGLNLGSPHWPGAGNPTLWWIPDVLWGIDMREYYLLHDWIADFNNPAHGENPFAWTDWEWDSFVAGIESSSNPAKWVLQIIYSSATSIVSIGSIWDSLLGWLDHELGFPDRYGDPNHGGRYGPRKR
ncbi:MAG: hypothetical protein R3B68_07350 [Phycisphaerales bacterium]